MENKEINIEQHNIEIHENIKSWENKELLRKAYKDFYKIIIESMNKDLRGKTVELGSGIGNLKRYYNDAICTDIFKNPWIDQVENAYLMSFENESISNLILFDVFHHLEYPGEALKEFNRVLVKKGRVLIFEPAISLFGLFVFGLLHNEPVALFDKINLHEKSIEKLKNSTYYAAQSNAYKIFCLKRYKEILKGWEILNINRFSAIRYILSGGYSKPSFLPSSLYEKTLFFEKFLDNFPLLFSTRMMIVLEKK